VRRLYAVADTAWSAGKPEQDLSLPSAPNCIEGVPKGSPDGLRVLLFRACAGERPGVAIADTARTQRTRIADGFGPDWNPAGLDANQRGLSGVWWDPATSGQGLAFEVYPDLLATGDGLLFGGWFTFDSNAGMAAAQRWYTLSGSIRADARTHTLEIYRNVGGSFAAGPVTSAQQVGSATLSFQSCNRATLGYAFTDGSARAGSIVLSRTTPTLTCAGGPSTPANADFEFSGFRSDPSLSGQGVFVEVNNAVPVVFLAWYTYAPDGQGLASAGQRWYTAQASFAAGARDFTMPLYETTGGAFNAATPAPRTIEVGRAILRWLDCTRAQLIYAFDAGSNAGRSGSIALTRPGTTPTGCHPP
jgi:hypothetical protein